MKSVVAKMILLFAIVLKTLCAQVPQLPALPRATVDLALPVQGKSSCPSLTEGSNCVRNIPPGDSHSLQSAINAATCGDTIVLKAGSTYSGNFTVPATSCVGNSGWIEIQSDAIGNLPPPGTRIDPSNANHMARISTPNISPAIAFWPGSNHWRLMGLEVTTTSASTRNTVYNLIIAGFARDNNTGAKVISELPAHLIFDRIYIHGLSNANVTRAIFMNTQASAVVDSYCDEIHSNFQDTQCFSVSNGTGPFLFQNNFIQAGAENIMFGGSDPAISNLIPADITIVGNLFQKNVSWKGQPPPYNWVIKNLLELKNAQRVLIDGNVFQYDWAAGQSYAILLRPVNQKGNCPWCATADVTFTHNLLRHVPGGIQIAFSLDLNNTTEAAQRILLQNNLILDSNSATWGNGNAFALSTGATPRGHDWIIDHNTAFSNHAFLMIGDSGTVAGLQLTNNIGFYGAYGIFGSGQGSGRRALEAYAPGIVYNKMLLQTTSGDAVANYPAGTFFKSWANTRFTAVAGTPPDVSGNFQLAVTSPFYRAGLDGKDVGVWDWACLRNDINAVMAGRFVPAADGCAMSTEVPTALAQNSNPTAN